MYQRQVPGYQRHYRYSARGSEEGTRKVEDGSVRGRRGRGNSEPVEGHKLMGWIWSWLYVVRNFAFLTTDEEKTASRLPKYTTIDLICRGL